ncbi:MAG: antibiotic biosynthesis monooxygenase [Bacteroidetes bacterium]|nr:antibiotic biosynthesis monooxygenase [Bacteroidota bacterium]MBU1372545.1 antibiotic biosynthesis monooxygenase [Bacteroidota bacterium]MBU1485046.1 antibiotic biosynthesis monooxygenase [Bacteroidota bacterium]MBU1760500.1 antibiotic biosynthesis monooxygenase [Bacteroidota bacterium]MBU2269333.1 antibiotic biosynthesis monooxygenase [Bacteroidota bacterium]
MMIRLVKMEFEEDKVALFSSIFEKVKPMISKMDGCVDVNLHQDIKNSNIFFTISHWENEAALNVYRDSELFINTWKKVKPLFKNKAEAWSLSS